VSPCLTAKPTGSQLKIRVTPKASADRLGPVHGDELKVAITTAAEKGKANAHAIKLLAKKLGVAKTAIEIVAGETDRHKTLLIAGLSPDEVRTRLEL